MRWKIIVVVVVGSGEKCVVNNVQFSLLLWHSFAQPRPQPLDTFINYTLNFSPRIATTITIASNTKRLETCMCQMQKGRHFAVCVCVSVIHTSMCVCVWVFLSPPQKHASTFSAGLTHNLTHSLVACVLY